MSLINQMLKDLENRSKSGNRQTVRVSGIRYSSYSHSGFKFYWIVLVFLLGLAIYAGWKKIPFHHAPKRILSMHLATLTEKIHSNPVSIPHSVPTVLTSITLQIQDKITSLRLSLTQDTLYRVDTDIKQNKIILFLDHAHAISGLPPINYSNSAIKNIEMMNEANGDLKIILTLNANSELNQLTMNESGKYPELNMDLTYQPEITTDKPIHENPVISQKTINFKKIYTNLTVQETYQQAINFIGVGKYPIAIDILKNIVDKNPTYAAARETLCELLLQQGDRKSANYFVMAGLKLQPDYLPFVEFRAHILADENKPKEALSLLESFSPSIVENPNYHAFIAALYQRIGDANMSAKLYEQLLHVDSEKAVWWVGLGIALESQGRMHEAAGAYARASHCDGLTPELSAYISTRLLG